MGLDDVLQETFGSADAASYEKAVKFIEGLIYPGIITPDEAGRIIKQIDEIEDMEG